jgi:general secretion pathway protein K
MKDLYSFLWAADKQRGAALLMAIAAAGILTAIAVEFIDDAQDDIHLVEAYRDDFKARWAVRAPASIAIGLLGGKGDNFTSLNQKWANLNEVLLVGDVHVRFQIKDESGKINLNALNSSDKILRRRTLEILEKLFKRKSLSLGLVSYLRDWVDRDSDEGESGAEKSYYRSLPEPFDIKNQELDSLAEISLVRGFTNKVLASLEFEVRAGIPDLGINRFFTVFSDGRVNLNTADRQILEDLTEDFPSNFVQELLERRETDPIQKIEEIKTMAGMSEGLYNKISPLLTVKSNYFSVISEATSGRIKKRLVAIIKKEGKRARIIFWRVS